MSQVLLSPRLEEGLEVQKKLGNPLKYSSNTVRQHVRENKINLFIALNIYSTNIKVLYTNVYMLYVSLCLYLLHLNTILASA